MENLWKRIRKSVAEGVSIATEKSEEFTKLGKLKLEIMNTKRKISKSFTELGGLTYDAFKEGKTNEIAKSSEVKELISSIKELEAELDGKEQKFDEMKKKSEKEE